MQIHVERSGGIAGMRLSGDFDTATCSPEDRQQVESLLQATNFFALPESLRPAKPGADRFQYKITVQDGAKQHTVSLDDAAATPELRTLLSWLTPRLRRQAS
jgi:hypothetical protein